MAQHPDLDALVRRRIRELRLARGWSLAALAGRCGTSASTLSRIETGPRRIALDRLVPIARALGTTLDQLVAPGDEAAEVVVAPRHRPDRGTTTWEITRECDEGPLAARMRLTRPAPPPGDPRLTVHPGTDWFVVLSGTVELTLGGRTLAVGPGEAARFPTTVPHGFGARGGPAELLTVFTTDGRRSHLPPPS